MVLLALAVEERNVPQARSSIEGLLRPYNALLANEVDTALHVALQACDQYADAALPACEYALAKATNAGYV